MKRGGEGPQMEAQSFTFHEADNYLREYTWPDEAWESITLDQTVVPSPITSNSQSIDYVSSFIFLRTLPRNDRPPSEWKTYYGFHSKIFIDIIDIHSMDPYLCINFPPRDVIYFFCKREKFLIFFITVSVNFLPRR